MYFYIFVLLVIILLLRIVQALPTKNLNRIKSNKLNKPCKSCIVLGSGIVICYTSQSSHNDGSQRQNLFRWSYNGDAPTTQRARLCHQIQATSIYSFIERYIKYPK